MNAFPHQYQVKLTAAEASDIQLESPGLTMLPSAPPAEFGGRGDLWSPETLFVAAVGDCMVLTFRAIAKASRLKWTSIVCDASGTVDRIDGTMRFTAIHLLAKLLIPPGTDAEKARRMVEKAEKGCLISRSLNFEPTLEIQIRVE